MRVPERLGRWLALLLPLAVLALTLLLWVRVGSAERAHLAENVAIEADWIREELSGELSARARELERFAARWRGVGFVPRDAWEFDVGLLLTGDSAWRSIHWLEPSLALRWSVPADADGAGGGGPLLWQELEGAAEAARGSEAASVGGPFRLSDGNAVVGIVVPTVLERGFDGYLAGIYDLSRLAREVARQAGPGYAVSVTSDGAPVHRGAPSSEAAESGPTRAVRFRAAGLPLHVEVRATSAARQGGGSALPTITLVGGVLLSLLVFLAVRLARVSGVRKKEAEMADRLRQEVRSRRRAEASLKRRAAELARSNAELEQFARAISHDLKDPLNAIGLSLQRLEQRLHEGDGELSMEDGRRYVRTASDAVRRMDAMIRDLLDYSRATTTEHVVSPVECDDVLDRALENLSAELREADAEIERAELPRVRADRTLLVQLFQNLVGNAVKYRSDEPPRIRIDAERRGELWEVRVADNGIGMEPDDAERAFEMFYRGRDADEVEGTGIGLATCRRIVQVHGGEIGIDTEPGAGTTVRFTLPVVGDDETVDGGAG